MIWIALSGIAFGTLGIFVKWIYTQGVTAHTTLTLRFVIATLFFGSALGARGISRRYKHFFLSDRSTFHSALLLGALGYAGFASCFMKALETLNASTTVLLLYTYPVFVWLGERLLFRIPRETPGWILAVAILGVFLISGTERGTTADSNLASSIGVIYGLMAAILYAGYILFSRRQLRPEGSALEFSFFVHLGASLVLVGSGFLFTGITETLWTLWNGIRSAPLAFLGLATLPTILAITLFLKGLQSGTGMQAALASITEPVSAVIFSAVLLNEPMTTQKILGSILILGSLVTNQIILNRKT